METINPPSTPQLGVQIFFHQSLQKCKANNIIPRLVLTTTQYIIIGSAVVVVLIVLAICGVFMSKGKRNTSIAVSNINWSIEPYGMYDTGYNNNNYYNNQNYNTGYNNDNNYYNTTGGW